MGYDSKIVRHSVFVSAAAVGAHSNASADGFRQRDVRFLLELFSNWVEESIYEEALGIQPTQIARYLDTLVAEGFARRAGRGAPPRYRLTRLGLIELLGRLSRPETRPGRGEFFFILYFLESYREQIVSLIKEEGRQYPPSLRIELDALLDTSAMLGREIAETERELKKLDVRISDAQATIELVARGRKEGRDLEDIIREAERLYPYELNSQKPLHELMHSLPDALRSWEMEIGNTHRITQLWRPRRVLVASYLDELRSLTKSRVAKP